MRFAALLFLSAIYVLPAAAAPNVLEATRAAAAPVIDGKLDDACWAAARPVSAFLINNTETPAKYSTSAMVVFDDSTLYIAARCSEPNVADIQTEALGRDHDNVFRTDCVEVMLDPAGTRNDFFHIGVNASGSVADRACTQGGFIGDMSWDAPVTAASYIGGDFWSCELAIPFYALGLTPQVGTTWRINICREKKKPVENSSLGEQGAFNIASRFIELRDLTADLKPYLYVLSPPKATQAVREGKVELALQVPVLNATGQAGPRLLDAWLVSPTEQVAAAKATIEPPVGQETSFPLGPIMLAEQGDYTCYIRVADPVTKRPLALLKTPLGVRYVPVGIRLVAPWYRACIFATQKLKDVVVEVDVSLDPAAVKGHSLVVTVVGAAGGEALATKTVKPVGKTNRVSFPVAPLPEGKLALVATLKDAAGKTVVESRQALRKLPYHKGEVWLGQDLQWRVDGQPFFLNGAWNYPEDFVPEYNAFTGDKPGDTKLLDCTIMNELFYKAPSLKGEQLSDEDAAMMRAYAAKAMANPKLFGYYVSDEPEVYGTRARVLEQVYDTFADADPYHPVIISNDSMEGLRSYARGADINGLHPYPVTLRDKPINDLSPVAVFMEGAVKFFADKPHKQTMAYLHQGFNYGDYGAVNNRIPTYEEYRGQNLLALIGGARGTIQFNRMVAHYPELHLGMPHLTRELAYLEPVMLAPEARPQPTADSDKLKVLAKQHGKDLYVLACNADLTPRDITLTLPGLGARELRVVSEDRTVSVAGGKLADHFGPFEAHIYTTAPAPKLPTVKSIVDEIATANEKRRRPGNLAFQMFEGDGVVVSASTSECGKYQRPDNGLWHVVDGVVDKIDHYSCLTWQDTTKDEYPDWLEIKLPRAQAIGRVVVYPFEKTLRDYAVQAFVDGEWREVAAVTGQSADQITHEFAPVTTDRVRLYVTATNGPTAKVTEVEVYAK